MQFIKNRRSTHVIPILKHHIIPGATVFSDEHSTYVHISSATSRLARLIQVYHFFVCHNAGVYVDQKFTFLHTFNIEGTWSRLKRFGSRGLKMATKRATIDRFCSEFCLRGLVKQPLLYDFALRRIRDYYFIMAGREVAHTGSECLSMPYLTAIDRSVFRHERGCTKGTGVGHYVSVDLDELQSYGTPDYDMDSSFMRLFRISQNRTYRPFKYHMQVPLGLNIGEAFRKKHIRDKVQSERKGLHGMDVSSVDEEELEHQKQLRKARKQNQISIYKKNK